MQCPECGSRGYCYATKPAGTVKQRYRMCRLCGHRFSTWEEIEKRDLRGYETKSPVQDLFASSKKKEGPDG